MKYKLQYIAANKVSQMPLRIPKNFRHTIKILSKNPIELFEIVMLTQNKSLIIDDESFIFYNNYIFYFANVNDRFLFLLKYL
jgi:hypothetical protein